MNKIFKNTDEMAEFYGIKKHDKDVEGSIIEYPDGTWKACKDMTTEELIEVFGLEITILCIAEGE